MSPKITFVIRTYNEQKYIAALLESIKMQKTAFEIEVIVVDSGSTDKTVQIARELYDCKIIHIEKSAFTYGYALNIGFLNSSGNYVFVVSGHCRLCHDDYVNNVIAEFSKSKNIGIIFGPHEGDESTRSSEVNYFKTLFGGRYLVYPNNANCVYKKVVWEKLKFNESLPGLEDKEFALRALELNYGFRYLESAKVLHIHNEKNIQVLRRFYRETYADMLISGQDYKINFFIKYLPCDFLNDLSYIVKNKKFLKSFKGIVGYRLSQYCGIWLAIRMFNGKSHSLLIKFIFKLLYPEASLKNETKI